jgi:hypothetical protein
LVGISHGRFRRHLRIGLNEVGNARRRLLLANFHSFVPWRPSC